MKSDEPSCPPCTGRCNQGRDCPDLMSERNFDDAPLEMLARVMACAAALLFAYGVSAWVLL